MARQTLVLHDYLTQRGGAERVALMLSQHLGGGRITTAAYSSDDTFPEFGDVEVTELAAAVPRRAKRARLSLAPLAAATFSRHTAEADVVLCSSSGWSHWTATPSPTVVYCYTPPRWFWAPQDYFLDLARPVRSAATRSLAVGRGVDRKHALTRGRYVAISTVVRDRIRQAYGIDADVVCPPVTLDVAPPTEPVAGVEPGYVLVVARNRGYKNVEVAKRLFEAGGLGQLVVVGDGERGASPSGRVRSTGWVSDAELSWLYDNARGVLALSREDFGLTPVEGHLHGTPTVALRAGGYLDTCLEGVNAVFTDDLEDASVRRAVTELDRLDLEPGGVRATAERFSTETFLRSMSTILDDTAAMV